MLSETRPRRRRVRIKRPQRLRLAASVLIAGAVLGEILMPKIALTPKAPLPATIPFGQWGPKPAWFQTKAVSATLAVSGGPTLYAFHPNQERPIASTTKIMTAYLVLHDLQPNRLVTITANEAQAYRVGVAHGDSESPVYAGEKVSVQNLLWALMLPSADDAAAILARVDAGSVTAFVAKMNQTAAKLGMRHTHYQDSSGVSSKGYSTVTDLLHLTEAAMAMPAFRQLVGTQSVKAGPFGRLVNLNRLLKQPGIIGVKTGWTTAAGSCLVFARRLSQTGLTLYGVVLGEPSFSGMFSDVSQLLATGSAITSATVIRRGQPVGRIRIQPGGPAIPVVAANDLTAYTTSASVSDQVHWSLPSSRRLRSGEVVGTLVVKQTGWPVKRVPLTVSKSYAPPWWSGFKW